MLVLVAGTRAGAVPKACTCAGAKQKRKSDINRIIIVVEVVNKEGKSRVLVVYRVR